MFKRESIRHAGGGERITKQSDRAQTDINQIMDRWINHGVIPLGREGARYGDFRSSLDYHEALTRVRRAEEEFAALPSRVRDHVDNDPGKFLAMCFDPDRRGELVELGLAEEQLAPIVHEPAELVARGSAGKAEDGHESATSRDSEDTAEKR